MRRWMSESFYRLVDLIPAGMKYRLLHTPLHGLYRSLSTAVGSPIEDGYHMIVSGPLQGKQLYTGLENVRGYPSVREYLQGIYEPMVADAIVENCIPRTSVLDIGAHYGYFSLLMAQTVGKDGRCIAFEANRSNYEKILRTKEANQLAQLQVEYLAITNHSGRVVFSDHVNSLMGHIIERDATFDDQTETVPATAIDLYVEQNKITNIAFMKIDIEGAERNAISGGAGTIQKYKPTLLIEVHTFISPDELARPLVADLMRMDYQVYNLTDRKKVNLLNFTGGHILAKPAV